MAQTGAEQKRSAFRMPVSFGVVYTMEGRRGRRSAVANDLSAGGLRLLTDEDFIKGTHLTLEFELPEAFLDHMVVEKEVYEQTPFGLRPESLKVRPLGFAPVRVEAEVLLTCYDVAAKSFAHGLAFIDLDPKVEEELQRFMHLWQIDYLRARHGDA